MQKRKIDAVYFYMRSLMSSNPFESARESLMDLFNETKKKVPLCCTVCVWIENVETLLLSHFAKNNTHSFEKKIGFHRITEETLFVQLFYGRKINFL